MKKLLNYLMQGVLYIAPLGLTVYVIYSLFSFVDNLLEDTLYSIINMDIPGLGLLIIVLLLILTGIVGQSIIASPIKVVIKRIIDGTPLLKLLYSTFNDLFSAFVGKEKKFTKPVLVMINPAANLQKIGFLTEDDLSKIDEIDKVAVYFPHSYAFSGELFIVPKEQVKLLNMNASTAMKFIVSGGASELYDKK